MSLTFFKNKLTVWKNHASSVENQSMEEQTRNSAAICAGILTTIA